MALYGHLGNLNDKAFVKQVEACKFLYVLDCRPSFVCFLFVAIMGAGGCIDELDGSSVTCAPETKKPPGKVVFRRFSKSANF